jgi:hypothetical protein
MNIRQTEKYLDKLRRLHPVIFSLKNAKMTLEMGGLYYWMTDYYMIPQGNSP